MPGRTTNTLRYEPLARPPALEGFGDAVRGGFARYDEWRTQWRELSRALTRHAVLFCCDLMALLLSATLGYLAWARLFLDQPASAYLNLLPLLCLFPFSYAAAGLYPGFALGPVETLRRLSYSTSVSFLALAAASFAFKADPRYSRMTFAITWLASLVVVPIFRSLAPSIGRGFRSWREPIVIFGTAPQIRSAINSFDNGFALRYEIIGALCPDGESVGRRIGDVPVLGGVELVPSLAKRGVTTMLAWDSPSAASQLAHIRQGVQRIVFIREEALLPVERVQVRNLGGVLGIEVTNELLRRRSQIIKRAVDLTLGAVGLLAAAPVIGVCGLLIKLTSRGPIFFRQEREGLHGCRFTVWKLRTMYPDAEARLAEVLSRDPELRRQWQHSVKLARDPRLIPVIGALLRRFSLDELPQLWNVITGEMSLVGPRPFPEYHLGMLPPQFRIFRRAVQPGLTGMWQVTVRSDGGVDQQERFDTYYIRNWSVWLDLYILARTLYAVAFARGAY